MKELQRTDRLLIATGVFILILVIGLLTIKRPYLEYSRDLLSSARDAQNPSMTVYPNDVAALLGQGSKVLLVDVRSEYDFARGHLDNALQIPKIDLLTKKNVEMFRDAVKEHRTIVLYGKDQLDVTAPAMLLRDLGIGDVKVIAGGYEAARKALSGEQADPEEYNAEKAAYNYSEMAKAPPADASAPTNLAPEIVMPVKKAKGKAEGGC